MALYRWNIIQIIYFFSLFLDSPEVQPRFVKGSKRYGRRSAPEFIHAESHRQAEDEDVKDEDAQTGDDRTVPRKREVTHTHTEVMHVMLGHILLFWWCLNPSYHIDNTEGCLHKHSNYVRRKFRTNPDELAIWACVCVCFCPLH